MVKFLVIAGIIIAVLIISSIITAWAIRRRPGLEQHRTGLFWSVAVLLGLIAAIFYKRGMKDGKSPRGKKDI
jgi:uncharacterized membrane protein YGL010W